MKETKNDILRIIISINITLFLSLKALHLFYIKDILPATFLILASISFAIGFTYGIKTRLFLKYYYALSFLYFIGFSYYAVNDSTVFIFLIIVLMVAYLIYYFIAFSLYNIANKNKPNDKHATLESNKENELYKFMLYLVITLISLGFAAYQVYITIDNYFDKKARHKANETYRINKHTAWVNKMTYHFEHLSTHHYIKAVQLCKTSTGSYDKFLKVIEVNNSEIKAIDFDVPTFTPIIRLLENSYMKDDKKDTIILNIEQLKRTIFEDMEIGDNLYKYQDSLKKEGLFWLVRDMEYINGPFLKEHIDASVSSTEHSLYFKFKNINTKATLTKIVNLSGDAIWRTKLPMQIHGFELNNYDYSTEEEFTLRATNIDADKFFKFELHFEDSLKNEHVFLVNRNKPSSYECKRILD